MNEKFAHLSSQIQKKQDDAMEEYLVEYFGSVEEAIEFAKFFTIDVSETQYISDTSMSSDEFKLTATVVYRVRVKTAEELTNGGILEPWPEAIVTMQRVEIERSALIQKDYDEALIRGGVKNGR